jgi:hypothetical protein
MPRFFIARQTDSRAGSRPHSIPGGRATGLPAMEAAQIPSLPLTSRHKFAFNLSLTRLFQTLDRISRYFKAKFSALIR